jgi:hypothetical protein
MKKYLLIFYIFSLAIGQGLKNDVALSPVVTYWKTLSIEEKETFLFSYLVQVYETHTELKRILDTVELLNGIMIIELN